MRSCGRALSLSRSQHPALIPRVVFSATARPCLCRPPRGFGPYGRALGTANSVPDEKTLGFEAVVSSQALLKPDPRATGRRSAPAQPAAKGPDRGARPGRLAGGSPCSPRLREALGWASAGRRARCCGAQVTGHRAEAGGAGQSRPSPLAPFPGAR